MSSGSITTQNDLLLTKLMEFYRIDDNLQRMLRIINGESKISLRIVDWFATNYSKKYFTIYNIKSTGKRFKVYNDYKLKLKAYSKRRFDPFCRWDRIAVPLEKGGDTSIETTIGQLNFFKWTLENEVIDFIENNYEAIEKDMNSRNSTSRRKQDPENVTTTAQNKTRKRREELSISAVKTIKKEEVEIVVEFN